jgi:ribonucleoside-diphosphate reductase alpha chain
LGSYSWNKHRPTNIYNCCGDYLISTQTPDYQYLAARLAIFHLRKKSFKSFTPPPLFEHVRKFTALGIYDKDILDKYSKQEIEELDAYTERI